MRLKGLSENRLMEEVTNHSEFLKSIWKHRTESLFLKWAIPASFSLFSSFQNTIDSKQMFNIYKILPMTGFEPRTSGIGSNRSTNWATTTALFTCTFHDDVLPTYSQRICGLGQNGLFLLINCNLISLTHSNRLSTCFERSASNLRIMIYVAWVLWHFLDEFYH